MTFSAYFPDPVGEFGDNTRQAVRIARELCDNTEMLVTQMQLAKLDGDSFCYGSGQSNQHSQTLLRADLDDFCKSYKMLDELLNGEGQHEHLANLHKVGEVQWYGEAYGSYSAAMLAMANAMYNRLNPDRMSPLDPKELVAKRWTKATKLLVVLSKGIDIIRVGLQQEQTAIERLIQTTFGRAPRPSHIDKLNAAIHTSSRNRRQLVDVEQSVTNEAKQSPPFVFNPLQKAIWESLNGKALKVEQLADRVSAGDTKRLYSPGGIKEMKSAGLIDNKRGVGYFRPDALPPGMTPDK